jgi:hypothetical protein
MPALAIHSVEIEAKWLYSAAALTSIFFVSFCASGVLGSITVSTPFLKLASILSTSTPSGTLKFRSNAPKLHSLQTLILLLFLFLFSLLFFALDDQGAIGHLHLDVLRIHPGDFGHDFVCFLNSP